MLALVIGLLFTATAAYVGMNYCLPEMITFIKGAFPLMFFFGGLIAVIAGITSLKEESEEDKKE
ncbi:MAG: hypothetical protein A2252_12475 [Elusimicrobia bacterium RIFOXYA2_FULL_39_19]|nr:MAG: hypothetical protein A2252_12475 [Elusimicrobia bacterium RIFOXYA2_FULL_39_19]